MDDRIKVGIFKSDDLVRVKSVAGDVFHCIVCSTDVLSDGTENGKAPRHCNSWTIPVTPPGGYTPEWWKAREERERLNNN